LRSAAPPVGGTAGRIIANRSADARSVSLLFSEQAQACHPQAVFVANKEGASDEAAMTATGTLLAIDQK
jgi:hypothetical protein